jgi:hypothetical protein
MRRIERATAFKRDYRRAKAISRYRNLGERLVAVLELLVNDRPLPISSRAGRRPELLFRLCRLLVALSPPVLHAHVPVLISLGRISGKLIPIPVYKLDKT